MQVMPTRLPTGYLAAIHIIIIRLLQQWVPPDPRQHFMETTGPISLLFRAMWLPVFYSENLITLKTMTTGHFSGDKMKEPLLAIPVI